MKLANLLMERRIKINLEARTKDEAILELLDLLKVQQKDGILILKKMAPNLLI